MAITSAYLPLQDAQEKLGYAHSNGVSADFSIDSGESVHSLIDEYLEPLALHVQECNLALDAVNGAIEKVGNLRPLASLTLEEMGRAVDSAEVAGQKFADATDRVKTVIVNSRGLPDSLRPTSAQLSTYISNGLRSLEYGQMEEEQIANVKEIIGKVLPADHEVSQATAGLLESASTMTNMTKEANEHIKGDAVEGADAGPSQLQDFVENLQVSLVLLGSALDKPLDQFAALLRDATSKVTEADLTYLKGLRDRLKKSTDTHNASYELRDEMRVSILKLKADIDAVRRAL